MRGRVTDIFSRALAVLCLAGCIAAAAPALASSEAAKPSGPVFVKLPPIILPVFNGNTVARQAGVTLALELNEGKAESDIEPQRRRLVDAFISDLYAMFEERHDEDRVIDAALIKGRLGETAARILGPGIVREVLIQQAFERSRGR